MPTEDRTDDLEHGALEGALCYLRAARTALDCITAAESKAAVQSIRRRVAYAVKQVENLYTRADRKRRYKLEKANDRAQHRANAKPSDGAQATEG